MKRPSFESASGLRPASAYLMIVFALLVVGGKSWILACEEDHHQPRGGKKLDVLPAPDFDIVDRDYKSLAQSVQRMNLRLSPRSMWQAHTPGELAEKIAQLLEGEREVHDLLADFFPSARAGVIRVNHKDWSLDYEAARRVEAWAHEHQLDEMIWLERSKNRAVWRLHWRPVELLSVEARLKQGTSTKPMAPIVWTRRLADGLAAAHNPGLADGDEPLTWKQLEARRARVWRALLPSADTVAFHGLPARSVLPLIELLDREFVQKHQMSIEFEHERVYPVRNGSVSSEAWAVLGKWRYVDEAEALRLANQEDPQADQQQQERRARQLLDVKHPGGGLEGLASQLLAGEEFSFIAPKAASYEYRKSVPVHEASRRYYHDDKTEGPTPRVFTTLDAELQEFLHFSLRKTVEEHRAAAAGAIVIDLETGDVLAVEGFSSYQVAEFIPTYHLFSPGSTFKVVVMATALEAGVVTPGEQFDTHNGNYPVPGARRIIREAQGAPKGMISAAQGIALSVNAVLVQIGMRVPDDYFHAKLLELGYHDLPETGIGKERRGQLTPLPWVPGYTHASVSFGHELTVSLWQHAAALATILRGGIARPLRMISGVEWGDEHYRLHLEDGERVYSESTCRSVRDMMELGAREGTGRHLHKAERDLGTRLEFLSKTGTTEKEASVACLHLEMQRNEHNADLPEGRDDPDFVTFKELKGMPVPHGGSCYTSSICLSGRVPGEDREVLVLMAVEEPRSKKKFGSDVAGPAAMRVLKEALGLTEGGVCISRRGEFDQDYGYELEEDGQALPWVMPHVGDEERNW